MAYYYSIQTAADPLTTALHFLQYMLCSTVARYPVRRTVVHCYCTSQVISPRTAPAAVAFSEGRRHSKKSVCFASKIPVRNCLLISKAAQLSLMLENQGTTVQHPNAMLHNNMWRYSAAAAVADCCQARLHRVIKATQQTGVTCPCLIQTATV